jgi:acyl-CoA dehydrogenase
MTDSDFQLPFFDQHHRKLAQRAARFAAERIEPLARGAERRNLVDAGREFVRLLAEAELLSLYGSRTFDLRSICIVREALASASAFADSVFAVDGLGAYPVLLAGTDAQRAQYGPAIAGGTLIGAFALTEPEAGSDVSGIQTIARKAGDDYVLSGEKTLISNAGIADFYVVFAAAENSPAPGKKKPLTAFVVEATTPGLTVRTDIELMAPHPIGSLHFDGCRLPAGARLGADGEGFRIALATLDLFRASVGAAACGLAARALRDARDYTRQRRQFGSAIADFQATRFALADMATELEASRLLVYRAAWLKDTGVERITREASQAKLFATEAAQRIVDRAVQLHGGLGVTRGATVERLYREVRALRIYEGTSEIQRTIIARALLCPGPPPGES